MKLSDIVGNSGLSIYAEVALVLFLAAFVAIVWWVFRPAARRRWQHDAQLPFEDGSTPSSRSAAGVNHE
jgi:cbb3-type cytochrome oxidase subunit 3